MNKIKGYVVHIKFEEDTHYEPIANQYKTHDNGVDLLFEMTFWETDEDKRVVAPFGIRWENAVIGRLKEYATKEWFTGTHGEEPLFTINDVILSLKKLEGECREVVETLEEEHTYCSIGVWYDTIYEDGTIESHKDDTDWLGGIECDGSGYLDWEYIHNTGAFDNLPDVIELDTYSLSRQSDYADQDEGYIYYYSLDNTICVAIAEMTPTCEVIHHFADFPKWQWFSPSEARLAMQTLYGAESDRNAHWIANRISNNMKWLEVHSNFGEVVEDLSRLLDEALGEDNENL